jgi:thiol-disulfide isomerase/thioredoxin
MNLTDIKNKIGRSAGNIQFLLIILIVVVFTIVALLMYKRYALKNQKYVANNEFNSQPSRDITSVDIYFFYTEWCPHCKTAKPIWADFKAQMGETKVNGASLHFIEVDCDKDVATSDKFNVKGFPTIKLMKGNQIIEYDAKPSVVNLIEFVNTAMGAK